MAPHIPFEIITEILAKLPVKSLLKFRVVCKSWYSLISTKQFVRKHLSSSNTSIPKRVIQLSPKDITFYSLHDSMLVEESSPIEFPIENFNMPHWMNKEERRSFFMIIGYCDGLLCVKAYTDTIYRFFFLWNPSTRESKILPYTEEYFSFNYCCGFGYDYISDDYKVLIAAPPDQCYSYSCKSYKSMLFTLRTNSWRRIQEDFPFGAECRWDNKNMFATLVNGALHWMVIMLEGNNPWLIISFDLTTETYKEVEHFGSIRVDQYAGIGIGASNRGCLCLLVINRAVLNYEYWVMKQYGVQESWTVSAKIPLCMGAAVSVIVKPVTWFSENGYILFNGAGKLAIYNANNNSIRYLHEIPGNYSSTHGDAYVESLVSPKAYSNRGANEIRRVSINVGSMNRVVL